MAIFSRGRKIMRASKIDGYDGLFFLSASIVGGLMAKDLPDFRSISVLVCLAIIMALYLRRK